MGRIQAWTEGFLSVLGNKVGGRQPVAVSDIVMPTIDVTSYLVGRKLACENSLVVTSNVGDNTNFVVPDGEVWLLKTIAWTAVPPLAADRTNIKCELRRLPSPVLTSTLPVLFQPYMSSGSNNNRTIGQVQHFDEPLVLTPGVQIWFEVVDGNAANIAWAGRVGFYRLSQ